MRERIAAALKDAVNSDDQARICTLRLICAAIEDRDAGLGAEEEGAGKTPEAEIVSVLATMVRQREATIRDYEESGRLTDAEQKRHEVEIIREFLPKPMSDAEIHGAVEKAIRDSGASSLRDMGAVMSRLRARYQGRMDFCKVGAEVRSALG